MGSSQNVIASPALLGKTLMNHRKKLYNRKTYGKTVTQATLEENSRKGEDIEGKKMDLSVLAENYQVPEKELVMVIDSIGDLERGKIGNIKLENLPFLAALYRIPVLSLIYSVSEEVQSPLYNPLNENAKNMKENDLFIRIPFEIPESKGICYWVPKYLLAQSSMILLKIHIQPGGHTPKNHEGHEEDEIIEAVKGQLTVEFPEVRHLLPKEVSLSEGDRVHVIKEKHIIRNPSSDKESIVFIQRALDELEQIRKQK